MAANFVKSLVFNSSTTLAVLLPPTPKTIGTLPLFAVVIAWITTSFSSAFKVALSAVVPNITKYSTPPSITKFVILANASVSTEKSFLKGVTKATPVPINDCILYFF
jgi:hypothetical protein